MSEIASRRLPYRIRDGTYSEGMSFSGTRFEEPLVYVRVNDGLPEQILGEVYVGRVNRSATVALGRADGGLQPWEDVVSLVNGLNPKTDLSD
ncbi:MAG: hypothetical protein ACR2KW_03045 [Rubrobacter sp.]